MRVLLVISHIFSIRKPFMEKVIIEDCYLTSMEMVENKPKDWETYPEWQEMFEIYENIENTYYLRNTCLKKNYSNVKSIPNPLKISPIEVFQSNPESQSNDVILSNKKENLDQNKLVTISKSSTKEDSMAIKEDSIENLDEKHVRIETVSDTNSNTIKENGDIKNSMNETIVADDFDSELGSYVDSLLRVVEEAMLEAAYVIRLKLEAEEKEKRAKKPVVDFSTPYRPSTQPTTYRPVLLPPKKPENEIPVIVKKLSYDTNTGDDLLNNLNPLPKLHRPNFSRF
uniref:Uncharacterized protein n=1 Tax=Acrobeloides nanus TaxID=290746 RepID=A0A914CIG1_9BILA